MRKLTSPPSSIPFMIKEKNNNSWMTWLNRVFDKLTDDGIQEMTVSGAVGTGVRSLELNHATVVVAATIANSIDNQGLFIVKDTSASGTAAHTCTLTSGTWDGTNTVATLNAPGEALVVYFDSSGDGVILVNVGSVALT